ncbi:PIN domain-containing protein [Anabaena sphaerica FACHB-251]|uniref:PIN domain-containing protein n=1 Tax=Anabaena sphaerica FACHB-251 TaxID=2692883 RepID=A0A927A380_9NOST|nr:PIN domain-containing protein [Anabaena sphaerica]MBD2296449.1 PIN domain-containing protein [Anabaena sphaerica FACHB-251]
MNIILDACALIAFFRNEQGAEIVEHYLSDNQYICMIHAINLCEVYYNFLRTGGNTIADALVEDIQSLGLVIRDDLNVSFWRQVGGYKASIRRISLADCFALTLANRESGILVTSDRKEFEPVVPLNICQINFIR